MSKAKAHLRYHKDGSLWAWGQLRNNAPTGYWEWYRKDGTRLRSGYFEKGQQVGDWTTYDKTGAVYKVTTMKAPGDQPKRARSPASKRPAARQARATSPRRKPK